MKQEEKTKRTRERILNAAMNEFGQNGYAKTSLNNICKAGIPKGLLYHNFKNKDELYLTCVHQSIRHFMEYLTGQMEELTISNYMKVRMNFFQENSIEARLFFEIVLEPPVHLQDQILNLRIEFDKWNQNLYKQLLSKISLRAGVTMEDALAYFSLVQNMFHGYFGSPAFHELSFEERIKKHEMDLSKILDFMIYGIAKGEE